ILADEKGLHHCPILQVEVMGTAGAGDSFSSTLAFMLASGAEPHDALRAASINAASVVTHADTTEGLLDLDSLKNRASKAQKDPPASAWPGKARPARMAGSGAARLAAPAASPYPPQPETEEEAARA